MPTFKEVYAKAGRHHGDFGLRYIGYHPGLLLVKLFANTPLQPNTVSLINILWVIVPVLLLFHGGYIFGVLATAALLVNLVLDCFDGSLARFRNAKSLLGKYFEHMFHEISVPVLMFALSVFSYQEWGDARLLILGAFTAMSTFIIHASRRKKDAIILERSYKEGRLIPTKKFTRSFWAGEKKGVSWLAHHFIFAFNSIGHQDFFLFVAALLGWLQYAILFYGPFYILIALAKIVLEFRRGFKDYTL